MGIPKTSSEQYGYGPGRCFEVLQGQGEGNYFDTVSEYVHQRGGALFWGVELELEGRPIPQTLDSKLQLLQDTYKYIPDAALTWHDEDWRDGEIKHTKSDVARMLEWRSVELPGYDVIKYPQAPRTNLKAYENTKVLSLTLTELGRIDYVPAVLHNLYFNFAEKKDIPDRAKKLGDTALRHYIFSAGGEEFIRALSRANKSIYSSAT